MRLYFPPINDITTTPDAPPQFLTQARPYPESFIKVQRRHYPELQPLSTTASARECLDVIHALISSSKNWTFVARDDKNQAIEAMVVTPLMRFRDDVVFEIREGAPGYRAIHMRSKSRLGRGDLGANAKRIRIVLEELASRLNKK